MEVIREDTSRLGIEHPERQREDRMTVQELYDLTQKKTDPRKVEIRLRPHGGEIAEVELEEKGGEVFAYLIEEGAIRL